MKKLLISIIIASSLTLSGCESKLDPDKVVQSLAASRGFLEQAKINHPECQDPQELATNKICIAIQRAIAAHNLAVHTLIIACSGEPKEGDAPFTEGGPCSFQKGAEARLRATIEELDNALLALKGVLR